MTIQRIVGWAVNIVITGAMAGAIVVRVLIICSCTLLVAACSPGSGKGLDTSGRPIGDTPEPGDLPTIENIQARVFTPICVVCHIGAAGPATRFRQRSAKSLQRGVGDLPGAEPADTVGYSRVQRHPAERPAESQRGFRATARVLLMCIRRYSTFVRHPGIVRFL